MFEKIIKKITIAKYARKALAYIKSTYVLETQPDNSIDLDEGIKYSNRNQISIDDIRIREQAKHPQIEQQKPSNNTNTSSPKPVATENPIVIDESKTRYDLASPDEVYDWKQINAAMKKYSFLDKPELLSEVLDKAINKSFVDILIIHMRRQNLHPTTVYGNAQIDRKLFSKIVSDKEYKPSKDTAIALVLALNLTLDEANDMLSRAGYTFSHSNKRDIIIEYFIRERLYDIDDINDVLFKLGQKTLGR